MNFIFLLTTVVLCVPFGEKVKQKFAFELFENVLPEHAFVVMHSVPNLKIKPIHGLSKDYKFWAPEGLYRKRF